MITNPRVCALVSALHRERVHVFLADSVLHDVMNILQLFIKAYSQSFSEHSFHFTYCASAKNLNK